MFEVINQKLETTVYFINIYQKQTHFKILHVKKNLTNFLYIQRKT